MLQAIDLTKRYGDVQALAGFSLDVEAGEIVGLVGHNGAGKTTFVEMVSGLLQPDSGVVLVDGRSPGRARDRIGISPQHIALYRSIGFVLLGERPGYYRLPSGNADALIFGLSLSYDVEPA